VELEPLTNKEKVENSLRQEEKALK